ncbi:hypothetical protein V8E36_005330 [Tilletia maclaganii]
MVLPSFEEGWVEYILGPAADPFALPSASQSCLNILEPSIQRAYRLAYESVKAAHEGGPAPNWTSLWLDESFSTLPEGHSDRMKAHFDRYFKGIEDFVAQRAVGPQAGELRAHTVSVIDDEDQDAYDEENADAANHDDDISTGRAHQYTLSPSPAATSNRPAAITDVAASFARPAAAADIGPPPRSIPSASNAARESLRREFNDGIHQVWVYRGLHRWHLGLVEEVPLTFDQAVAEASANDPADQWSSVRERWECRVCKIQRHEQVGQTSNLAKHLKKCSPASK